jgi:hypothetical protein
MGKLRFVALCLAIAACGSDDRNGPADASIDAKVVLPDAKVFMDAPPPVYDFSCIGNAAPTMADANITLTGTVQQLDIQGITPSLSAVADASLKACVAGAANCTGQNQKGTTATSAADGSFSIGPIATSMAPLDVYVEMTKTNTRSVLSYPPSAFTTAPPTIPVLTFTDDALTTLGALGCNQDQNGANGVIGLAVTDCANKPISDLDEANIVIKQNGTAVTGLGIVNLGSVNQQAAGTFLICNVPPDAATNVGATYKTMALRAHDVKIVADTITATILRPGY